MRENLTKMYKHHTHWTEKIPTFETFLELLLIARDCCNNSSSDWSSV